MVRTCTNPAAVNSSITTVAGTPWPPRLAGTHYGHRAAAGADVSNGGIRLETQHLGELWRLRLGLPALLGDLSRVIIVLGGHARGAQQGGREDSHNSELSHG